MYVVCIVCIVRVVYVLYVSYVWCMNYMYVLHVLRNVICRQLLFPFVSHRPATQAQMGHAVFRPPTAKKETNFDRCIAAAYIETESKNGKEHQQEKSVMVL